MTEPTAPRRLNPSFPPQRFLPVPPLIKIDPGNKYLWRFNPRRLEAEQARDAMLAVSGELDLTEGGPSTDGFTSCSLREPGDATLHS